MDLIIFLIMATLILYVFTQYIPWVVDSFRHSLPPTPSSRQLPGYSSHLRRNYQRKKSDLSPQPRHTVHLQNLRSGDVVIVFHRDFLVGEQRQVREQNWSWRDYVLEDGNDICILSVADTGEDIFLLEPITDLTIPYPPPSTLTYQHHTYTQTSAGQAEIEDTQERFRYYTYEGPHKILIAENWGAQFDLFLGERLSPQDLTFLPGDQSEKNALPR